MERMARHIDKVKWDADNGNGNYMPAIYDIIDW